MTVEKIAGTYDNGNVIVRPKLNGDFTVTTFRVNRHGYCKPQLEAVERRMTAEQAEKFVAKYRREE